MSDYFAYTKRSRPTGRQLARLLGFRHFGIRTPRGELDLLIRWGSSRSMPEADRILNPASAIKKASDKVVALTLMGEAGISCIPWYLSWEDAVQNSEGTVVLGRTRTGMQGQGIVVYDPHDLYDGTYPREPQTPDEWYSIYQEPAREVRLHVVEGQIVRLQGKYLDFPENAQEHPFVRNHDAGYRYRAPRKDVRKNRKEMAIEAVRALGLNFGAVDMLIFGDERKPMILEINSAPACSPMTATAYAEALSRKVES